MEVPMETANGGHNTRPLNQLCSQLIYLSSQLNELQSSSSFLQSLWGPLNQLSIQLNQVSSQVNLFQFSHKASNQWCDLPTVILEKIYKRLNTRTDFNRMSAVCKPWRASLSSLKPLCYTKFEKHLSCFTEDFPIPKLHFDDHYSHQIQLAQFVFHLVSQHPNNGSTDIMWLAKTSNHSSTLLVDLDPAHTHEHISSLFRPHHVRHHVINMLNYRMAEVCRSYYLETPTIHHDRLEVLMVKIAVLSDTAESDVDFVLLGMSNKGKLGGWNTMTRSWCGIKGFGNKHKFEDVISYRNNFYAVNTRGQLYKISHKNWSSGKPTKDPPGTFKGIDDIGEWDYRNSYIFWPVLVLLESEGRLYLLLKHFEDRSDEQDNCILNIYVLDEKAWEWKAVTDIRNRVFFVLIHNDGNDPRSAFSLSAKDLRQDSGNCIYWFDQSEHDCDDHSQRDSWTKWEYSISSSSFRVKASWETTISEPLVVKSLRKDRW